MTKLKIFLGSKNISSWSLRAWLMLLQTGADFEAVFIQLNQPDSKEKISRISPSAKVPVLVHEHQVIWDSLAIGEYLAEIFPKANLWPEDIYARAHARSISCEMHAGFQYIREFMPFNPQEKKVLQSIPEKVNTEIKRIIEIWDLCRKQFHESGPFLFGKFSIADAMFAPVTSRFTTYQIELPPVAEEYVKNIMSLPEMKMWCHDV